LNSKVLYKKKLKVDLHYYMILIIL
jgi:hypothetical protein